jgi:hypothetical protein
MNAVEIEAELFRLSQDAFSPDSFAYNFLEAVGNPRVAIERLKRGDTNHSDVSGGTLQRNQIHIGIAAPGTVSETLVTLRKSPKTINCKVRFVMATDGESVEAEELSSGDIVAFPYSAFADHLGFFLPLAGITPVREIKENPVDVRATGRLNKLYVELLRANPAWADESRRFDLNQFMARLIFCFFAEDTGIFSGESLFTSTVMQFSDRDPADTGEIIRQLFVAMSLPPEERKDSDLPRWACAFPFVNGGLFDGKSSVPIFTRAARSYLFQTGQLDWKAINPDIFGSMIQAVADEEERGALGMHYTSVPNILRVLNPLFLDDLRAALDAAGDNKSRLDALRRRIARIRVFDPACGSGNFLVVAYKQLRELEAEINRRCGTWGRQSSIPLTNFRGIEIRAFSAEIARLALIISEFQCNVIYRGPQAALQFVLPLQSRNWIAHGNALRLDWNALCPPAGRDSRAVSQDLLQHATEPAEVGFANDGGETYICGNPPYKGSQVQNDDQKEDMQAVLAHRVRSWRSLDYVAGWFAKAVEYCTNHQASVAFVSTNSICQGRQVEALWPHILQNGLEIAFAYSSFKWANLASRNAGVTVVIVGLSTGVKGKRRLYSIDDSGGATLRPVDNINPYLVPGPNVVVRSNRTPLSSIPEMSFGSMPNDGGALLLSFQEAEEAVSTHGVPSRFIRPLLGTQELIKGIERRCIWISNLDATEAAEHPWIGARLAAVRETRLSSTRATTRELASTPHLFGEVRQRGDEQTIIVSGVSSERRPFLPASVLPPGVIVSNLAFALFDAPLWVLSLLVSRLHMVWSLAICGQLETRLRYSNTLAWNTFPVPALTDKNKSDLIGCAKEVLMSRERHFPSTIADLYDADSMPDDLRSAHERNDDVLERIFVGRRFRNDTERLEKLFDLYTKLTRAPAPQRARVRNAGGAT